MSSHPLSFSQRDLSWNIYSAFQATLRIRCAATTLIRVLRPRTQKIYLELLPEIKLADDPSTFPSSKRIVVCRSTVVTVGVMNCFAVQARKPYIARPAPLLVSIASIS
jgi:hypothetical protein